MVVFQTQRFVYTYTATVVCACGGIYTYIRLFCWWRTSPKLARCAGTVLVFKTPNPVLINIRFVRPTDFCVKTAAVVRPYPTPPPPVCPSVRSKYKGLTDTFVRTDIKLNFSQVINIIKRRINNNCREFHANKFPKHKYNYIDTGVLSSKPIRILIYIYIHIFFTRRSTTPIIHSILDRSTFILDPLALARSFSTCSTYTFSIAWQFSF